MTTHRYRVRRQSVYSVPPLIGIWRLTITSRTLYSHVNIIFAFCNIFVRWLTQHWHARSSRLDSTIVTQYCMVPQARLATICSVFRIGLHDSCALCNTSIIATSKSVALIDCWTTNLVQDHSNDIRVTNTSTTIVSSWVHQWLLSSSNFAFFESSSAQSLIYKDRNNRLCVLCGRLNTLEQSIHRRQKFYLFIPILSSAERTFV